MSAPPDSANRGKSRSGFLGGSFDPIHTGHLIMAQDAMEQLDIEKVFFIPAAQNPLKKEAPAATAEQRLAMISLAAEGNPRLGVLDVELQAGGTSYTLDTARKLTGLFPGHQLYWIIGADQMALLPDWHQIGELIERVRFACLPRSGYSRNPPEAYADYIDVVEGHIFDITSTEIRDRCKKQLSADLFLPPKVASFIQEQHLYR